MNAHSKQKTLWLVSREYAGIAEAGGVKNVVKSLAEFAAGAGSSDASACGVSYSVTVFLPLYGSCRLTLDTAIANGILRVNRTFHAVRYFQKYQKGIRFIFVDAEIFSEKKDIYVYNSEEVHFFRKKLNRPDLQKGEGYVDSHEMNILFQKAVFYFALQQRTAPDILHCHDAHTALLPAFIGTSTAGSALFCNTKKIITIHNAGDGYRQTMCPFSAAKELTGLPAAVLQAGCIDDCVEPFLVSTSFAHLSTVSPWYAAQLLTPEHSPYSYRFSQVLAEKQTAITGITNGIDYENYDPCNKPVSCLPFSFDIKHNDFDGKYACRRFLLEQLQSTERSGLPQEDVQWFGSFKHDTAQKYLYLMYHGRFVHQKGIDVLLQAVAALLEKDIFVRILIMGQGNSGFEQEAAELTEKFSGSCVYCKGYNRHAARLIIAAADFILLPSLFEPCGLEDLIAQMYGTIPIAHAQGGLQKIIHGRTGILYRMPKHTEQNSAAHTRELVNSILQQYKRFFDSPHERIADVPFFNDMIQHAQSLLRTRFSWQTVFKEYCRKLYAKDF